jgi:FKBP-type peptidyl-prolyl cis-trans isomerase (trigger factor)
VPITREEIERRMNELARKYVDTHDPELIKELYELAIELERMKKG